MNAADPTSGETLSTLAREVDTGLGVAAGTILWIHGYTMDSGLWQPLWDLLPEWCHVGVDLPGHGRSGSALTDYTGDQLALELLAVAEARRAEHVVAMSFGSGVALAMAALEPDRFTTVTLGAPTYGGGPVNPATATRFRQIIVAAALGADAVELATLWTARPNPMFDGLANHPARYRAALDAIERHRWTELAGIAGAELVPPLDLSSLSTVAGSTLLVVGEDDMRAFHYAAALLAAALPTCMAVEMVGTGHLPFLEDPATSADLIRRHLRTRVPQRRTRVAPMPRHRRRVQESKTKPV